MVERILPMFVMVVVVAAAASGLLFVVLSSSPDEGSPADQDGRETLFDRPIHGVWYGEIAVMREDGQRFFCLEVTEGQPESSPVPPLVPRDERRIPLRATVHWSSGLGYTETEDLNGALDPTSSVGPRTFTLESLDSDTAFRGELRGIDTFGIDSLKFGASGTWGNDPSTGATPVGGTWIAVRADATSCR